jgi:hypothetical protein
VEPGGEASEINQLNGQVELVGEMLVGGRLGRRGGLWAEGKCRVVVGVLRAELAISWGHFRVLKTLLVLQ